MAKFTEAPENIKEIVNDIANELGLAHMGVDFEAIYTTKSKEVVQVSKASAVMEYVSKRPDLILVICNEGAFESLETNDETKKYWIRIAMDAVSFDTEKNKIILDCPSITVPIGLYERDKQKCIDAALLGKYILAQLEEQEKERKAAEKLEKKSKKKKF